MPVERKIREVYYSPRRGRHFLTARGAALAEANARMYKAFPSEDAEYDDANYHQLIYPGWSFHSVPRLVAIRDRLVKRYLKALR